MKVLASVKKICRNCKIISRNGVVRVICTDPRHKQRQGLLLHDTSELEDANGTYCWYQHSAAKAHRDRSDLDLRHWPYDRAEDLQRLRYSPRQEGQGPQ